MRPCILVLLALLPLVAFSQSTNDAFGSLVVNSTPGAPATVIILTPATLVLEFGGEPDQPFILAEASTLDVGRVFIPPNLSFDLSLDTTILMDGLSPVTVLDLLANTGPTGMVTFTLPVPALTKTVALQAIMVSPSSPLGLAFTSATEIHFCKMTFDYGLITYSRGPGFFSHDGYTADGDGNVVTNTSAPSSDFDHYDIHLGGRWQELHEAGTLSGAGLPPGDIDRFVAPTAARPVRRAVSGDYPHIATIHGDLYSFEDNVTNEWGFFLAPRDGSPINVLARFSQSTFVGLETVVAISDDSSTMAFVLQPNDFSVYLARLDGGTFTANGQGVIEVTPGGMPIPRVNWESLTFSSGRLYFTGSPGNLDGGTLYQVDQDPLVPSAVPVVIPPTHSGGPVTEVDEEMYKHEPTGDVYFKGSASLSADVFRIDPGDGSVNRVTDIPMNVDVRSFGNAFDGGNRFSVSPSGATCAFVAIAPTLGDVLGVTDTDGNGTVAGPTGFIGGSIDSVAGLNMWSDDECLFFAGDDHFSMDLYSYDRITDFHLNVTRTSGEATPPFFTTGAIRPEGHFTANGRMIFARDGNIALGPSAGTSVMNLVGVDYATLMPYNVTGDEFPGSTGPNVSTSFIEDLQVCRAPQANEIWFTGADGVFHFDPDVSAPATRETEPGGGTALFHSLLPTDDGSQCLVVRDDGVDEDVGLVTSGSGVDILTDDGSGTTRVYEGTPRFLDPSAPFEGIVYSRSPSGSASAAVLEVFKLCNGSTLTIDSTQGLYWIYGVGP